MSLPPSDSIRKAVGSGPSLVRHPPQRAIVLRNITCAYCGRPFDTEILPTKEHVIGRRFVPKGCFNSQWNLILNACEPCNSDKADLEDDISAITMMPDAAGRHAVDDDRLRAEVARKSRKSRSRRTGKAVADSQEEIAFRGQFGSATFTFNFVAPPQVEEERLCRLAEYQFRGFFYWITYNLETRRGGFVPSGSFWLLSAVPRADWGAVRMRWFMDVSHSWDLRVHGVAADGFCKIIIRKSPHANMWSWAMEWNHALRIAGFAGDDAAIAALIANLPAESTTVVHETKTEWVRMRVNSGLSDEDDDLFKGFVEIEGETEHPGNEGQQGSGG